MKNLLKKWIAGGTTWEEEKNLRQAATNDDFLAEAMEGYDAFPNGNHSENIARLKSRLPNAQNKQKERAIFTLPRIAAAAAMIGVVSTLFWVQNQIEQPAVLSEQIEEVATPTPQRTIKPVAEKPQQSDIQLIAKEETNFFKSKKTQPLPNKSPQPKAKINQPNKSIEKDQPTKSGFADWETPSEPTESEMADVDIKESTIVAAPAPLESADIVTLSEPQPVEQVVENEPAVAATSARNVEVSPSPAATSSFYAQAEQQAVQKKKTQARSKRKAKVEKVNLYTGQVQNEDGQPLHNVDIVGFDTESKTASQANGDFILQTTTPLSEITLSKDGFHTRKVLINQYSDFLNVSLSKKSTKVPSDNLETIAPKPVKGLVHFYQYIDKNKVYPTIAKEKGIEREVEVRFMIDATGTPTDLKVVNPDSYGFDKEAVRLLQSGPKWIPTNSYARSFVSFELEK